MSIMKNYYVYIMSNKSKTLYIGVTNDLARRIYEHKNKMIDGFTKRYNLSVLIYFEVFNSVEDAIRREKQLKNWHRRWKINLIESINKDWKDYLMNLKSESEMLKRVQHDIIAFIVSMSTIWSSNGIYF
jgi:putative endonuclease